MDPIKFEIDPEWAKRFNEYLRDNNQAVDAFWSWIDAGIPQDWLLEMLYGYVDTSVRQSQQLRYRTMTISSLKEIDSVLKAVNKTSGAWSGSLAMKKYPIGSETTISTCVVIFPD